MAEKRRDNKGRILRTGESQRKDGRYAYKYTGPSGKPQFVYAWKLVPTDKTPAGKRDDISLREKVKEIQRDLDDGIDIIGKKMTVCQLYTKQNNQRKDVRRSTQNNRRYLMRLLQEDVIGSKSIDTVKPSDAKEWAVRMKEKGYCFQFIQNAKIALKAAFKIAIEDDYIRKNPFDFALNKVIEDDREEKIALTPEQEASLIAFAQNDPVYQKCADVLIILFGTGLRISEFCGLTTDLDFANGFIQVDHQLIRDAKIGYYIERPKTKTGSRKIPISGEVCQAFKRMLKNRVPKQTITVEGYTNFLCLNPEGLPYVAIHYNNVFRSLVQKYNKCHDKPLPNVTPHTCRHTFCTRMANQGMNPKSLQYIMGHSSMAMTMGYYAHADEVSVKAEMDRLAA